MLALGGDGAPRRGDGLRVAGIALVLLRQKIHRKMDTVEVAAGHFEVAWQFRPTGQCQRVEFREQPVDADIDPDLHRGTELDPLRRHLLDPAIDQVLLHLEIGDAVAQQPADAVGLLEQGHRMAGARQLLGASHAGRSRADYGNALASLPRRDLGHDPAFFPAAVDDRALDCFYRDRVVVDVQRAGGFARRRTDPAGEFREIVGGVQRDQRVLPLLAVDEVVPVRDQIVDRAPLVTERDAAIHAAHGLGTQHRLRKGFHELLPVFLARRRFFVAAIGALDLQKPGRLAHAVLEICPGPREPSGRSTMLTYINSASLGGYHQLLQAGHREIHAKGVLPTATAWAILRGTNPDC